VSVKLDTYHVASFEEWNCPDNQKYDMIYCAQAFHWLDTNIKYKKCHKFLKDNGYLILFWYKPCDDKSDVTKEIEQKVEKIVEKNVANHTFDNGKIERHTHLGASKENEIRAEIEVCGLFEIIEKIDYTQEINDNASQYLKAKKSIPAFASILDGFDDETIEKMDNEIEEVINSYGGYVGTFFEFSLYITKKVDSD
jgi:hypothetical protein